jgi:hypothetical protein
MVGEWGKIPPSSYIDKNIVSRSSQTVVNENPLSMKNPDFRDEIQTIRYNKDSEPPDLFRSSRTKETTKCDIRSIRTSTMNSHI